MMNLLPWHVSNEHPVPFPILVGDHHMAAGGAADFLVVCTTPCVYTWYGDGSEMQSNNKVGCFAWMMIGDALNNFATYIPWLVAAVVGNMRRSVARRSS
jgi:hypothetical protein